MNLYNKVEGVVFFSSKVLAIINGSHKFHINQTTKLHIEAWVHVKQEFIL